MSIDLHELAQVTHLPENQLQEQAYVLLLLPLYQEGKVSSSEAAHLLHTSRAEFQTICFENGVPIDDPDMNPVNEANYQL